MAIIPEDKYPNNTIPASTSYPYGSAKNISRSGDGTGYPFEQDSINDWLGFQQAILIAAGITPSGNPDTATNSQLLSALIAVITTSTDPLIAPLTALVTDPVTGVAAVASGFSALESDVDTLSTQASTNASDIAAETSARASAILQEVSDRQAAVQAAITAASDADAIIQGEVDAVSSTVAAQAGDITSQGTRITNVESGVSTINGDLVGIVDDITSLQTSINDGTTGLSATYNAAVLLQNRLNDVAGDSSGTTIEQLAAQVDGISSGSGFATTTELDAVEVRVGDTEDDILAQATQISTLQSGVATAQGDATTALANGATTQSEVDLLEGTVAAQGSQISTLQSGVTSAQNAADAAQLDATGAIADAAQVQTNLNTTNGNVASVTNRTTTLESTVGTTDSEGLRASVIQQASTLTSVQGDITTQKAGYAVVTNAGDSTAAIEVTADGGVGSEINLKADRVFIDDGSIRTNLFDSDGLLSEDRYRTKYLLFTSSKIFSPASNTEQFSLGSFLPGYYKVEIIFPIIKQVPSDSNIQVGAYLSGPAAIGYHATFNVTDLNAPLAAGGASSSHFASWLTAGSSSPQNNNAFEVDSAFSLGGTGFDHQVEGSQYLEISNASVVNLTIVSGIGTGDAEWQVTNRITATITKIN